MERPAPIRRSWVTLQELIPPGSLVRGLVSAALAVVAGSLLAASPLPTDRLPPTMLWAWEGPTRLTGLPPGVGVAYLAGTLVLSGEDVVSRPRLQRLVVDATTAVLPVIRIEVDASRALCLTAALEQKTAVAALALARHPRATGLQIDFDATPTERPFYAGLLGRLRGAMPASWPLSMTALASWCLGDPWIRGLPVDEAVPMLFQMGPDSRDIRRRLASGDDFSLAVCRTSIGLSLDEPLARVPAGRRRYVFSPRGWNEAATARAVRR